MWLFEFRFVGQTEWMRTQREPADIDTMSRFAASWMVACAENDAIIEVRMVRVG
jgi:hypothetical protein